MNKPILYVNACVRKNSRTKLLAEKLLARLGRPIEEVRLEEISFPVFNEAFNDRRDRLIAQGVFRILCLTLHGSFPKRTPS